MADPVTHECPLLSNFRRDEFGMWIPCYVRGTGWTEEIAQLHAEMLRAEKRWNIATRGDYGEPNCDESLHPESVKP